MSKVNGLCSFGGFTANADDAVTASGDISGPFVKPSGQNGDISGDAVDCDRFVVTFPVRHRCWGACPVESGDIFGPADGPRAARRSGRRRVVTFPDRASLG